MNDTATGTALSAAKIERIKLSATLVNTIAAGLLTAGGAGPGVAVFLGLTANTHVDPWSMLWAALGLVSGSFLLHIVAWIILRVGLGK